MTIPRPPAGAGPTGRRLWRAILADYELDAHELVLLGALARQADRLDELEKLIADQGLLTYGHGTTKVNPLVPEARNTAIGIARIAAALRLPVGDTDDISAPAARARRTGPRGVYQFPA
jgi:hypothetical protein